MSVCIPPNIIYIYFYKIYILFYSHIYFLNNFFHFTYLHIKYLCVYILYISYMLISCFIFYNAELILIIDRLHTCQLAYLLNVFAAPKSRITLRPQSFEDMQSSKKLELCEAYIPSRGQTRGHGLLVLALIHYTCSSHRVLSAMFFHIHVLFLDDFALKMAPSCSVSGQLVYLETTRL